MDRVMSTIIRIGILLEMARMQARTLEPKRRDEKTDMPFSATKVFLEFCMLLRGIFTDPALGHHVAENPIFMAGHYRA